MWRIGASCKELSQKREDDPSLFSGDKETATESETFFSGMTLGDLNDEAVFVEQEELFLHDSNIAELGDLNNEAVFCQAGRDVFARLKH